MGDYMHKVYLVPGFFGFDQLGGMSYFRRVSQLLESELAERGIEADVVELSTAPTSSIRRRAVDLLEAVEATGGLEADSISFVGHSTGGLDIRLLLSPGVKLVPDDREDRIAERTVAAISLATPHFGTPMANFFTSLNGRYLLYVLSTLVTTKPGRVGAWLGARALMRIARLDDKLGQRDTVLDTFATDLFQRLRPDSGHDLFEYMSEVAVDQGAMLQLTPEAIDLFNAAVLDRDGTDYVSYVTAAPPPSAPPLPGVTPSSFYESATYMMFSVIHRMAARESRQYPYPSPHVELSDDIAAKLPFELSSATNDGVVPTLSQVWGRLGGVCIADHLDVIGQYTHRDSDGHFEGWLHCGAGFGREEFEGLWSSIASDVAASAARASIDLREPKASTSKGRKSVPTG